jgi:hypothetical protein
MPKIGSFGYLTVCDVQNDGIRPSDAALPYLLSFIRDVTNKLPVPGEDTYSFICHQFTAFSPSGSSTSINYFDKDHISSKDLMQLRI